MLKNPKLRPVEAHWIRHQGQQTLLLRDPLGMSDKTLLIPAALATLLALCDGSRDLPTIRAAFELRTGLALTPQQLQQALDQLDEALILESPRFFHARAEALAHYRQVPHRVPILAGAGYPADPHQLRALLEGYAAGDGKPAAETPEQDAICGLISPHIDYHRGGPVYARAWLPVATALRSTDLVIILGTDHAGAPGQLTPTRQSYATPWGVLPTAKDVAGALAAEIGEEDAYASELNHRHEHSIELTTVWLHYLLGDHPCELLPILCGSFHHFVTGECDPAADERIERAIAVLRGAMASRRTLVVAAADLAHVGPAFGDPAPLGATERNDLRLADTALLAAAASGDAAAFFAPLRAERDARRVCGLPPIYLMLRLIEGARGEVTGYAQCPADEQRGSWVSVAGVVFRSTA